MEEIRLSNSLDCMPGHDESRSDGERRDEEDGNRGLDDQKMIKVCDKLIEVFMVDKPTPTDWRRLLAFSKEWNNIRPHFYNRCQDRADAESDPGMKHKLLRLGRKLKEVGSITFHGLYLENPKRLLVTFLKYEFIVSMLCLPSIIYYIL